MRRRTASLVLLAAATAVLTACGPPAQTGLTTAQCERFDAARESFELYTDDDWATFQNGEGVRVLSGVQRAAGDVEEASTELGTTETKDAVDAVVAASRAYARLAGDYMHDPPVADDAADLAEQAAVRDALDDALAGCG